MSELGRSWAVPQSRESWAEEKTPDSSNVLEEQWEEESRVRPEQGWCKALGRKGWQQERRRMSQTWGKREEKGPFFPKGKNASFQNLDKNSNLSHLSSAFSKHLWNAAARLLRVCQLELHSPTGCTLLISHTTALLAFPIHLPSFKEQRALINPSGCTRQPSASEPWQDVIQASPIYLMSVRTRIFNYRLICFLAQQPAFLKCTDLEEQLWKDAGAVPSPGPSEQGWLQPGDVGLLQQTPRGEGSWASTSISAVLPHGDCRRSPEMRGEPQAWDRSLVLCSPAQPSCKLILTSKLCFLSCDTHMAFLFCFCFFFPSLPSLLIYFEKEI